MFVVCLAEGFESATPWEEGIYAYGYIKRIKVRMFYMIAEEPKFMSSPYFVMEFGNWHLLPGAPEDIVREFEDFMANDDE